MSEARKPDPNDKFRSAITPHNVVATWGLAENSKGYPLGNLSNAVLVLQKDPYWALGALWYDAFLDRVLMRDECGVTREWRDTDDARFTVYAQQKIGMSTIAESIAASAVRYVARQRTRHAVCDSVGLETWDATERIQHALEDYWGVVCDSSQPSDYVRAVSANFLLGMAARVLHPGCQLDTMVIFEGPQGIGKSRALRVLGGDYYMLAAESVASKDFFQALPGKWLVEVGEMESFSRAERERVKLVISTPIDRYRPSHARHARDFPRQCVFAGTTNRDDYGADDTGLRRFLPVRCGEIDIDGLVVARPQLLAEAFARVRAGAAWWHTPDVPTRLVQRDRQSEDIWTSLVLAHLINKTEVQIHDILREACKVREADMSHAHKLRIGSILRLAGWSKTVKRQDGILAKTWVAPRDE